MSNSGLAWRAVWRLRRSRWHMLLQRQLHPRASVARKVRDAVVHVTHSCALQMYGDDRNVVTYDELRVASVPCEVDLPVTLRELALFHTHTPVERDRVARAT